MANFVDVPKTAIFCKWVCEECGNFSHIHPSDHQEIGNPMCCECDNDSEMVFHSVLVDDSFLCKCPKG